MFILENQRQSGVWVYPSALEGSIGHIKFTYNPFGGIADYTAYLFTKTKGVETYIGYSTDFFNVLSCFDRYIQEGYGS